MENTTKKIVGYKFFKTTEDFELWQMQNTEFRVAQITPVPYNFKGGTDSDDDNKINIDVSEPMIFVTFIKEVLVNGLVV